MGEFNIELQKNILINYVSVIDKAISERQSFINAIDLEIMNIAKNILSGEINYSIAERAFNILEERTEQEIIYTPKHIEVCKAIKRVYLSLVSESESAIAVSCVTEFMEQGTPEVEMIERVNEILEQLNGKFSKDE